MRDAAAAGQVRGETWDLAQRYGLARFCRGVHARDVSVLELEADPTAAKAMAEACLAALDTDGSDVVMLGCAGASSGSGSGYRWWTGWPPPC